MVMRVRTVVGGLLLVVACTGSDPDLVRPSTDAGASSGAPVAAFTIALPTTPVLLPKNGAVTIDVKVVRAGGFADPISVTTSGLPTGVTQDPLAIAGDAGTLTLHGSNAALATVTVNVTATSGAAIAAGIFTLTVQGTAGDLDPSFNANGEVRYQPDAGDTFDPVAVVVQPDNKIVLGGTRHGSSGSRFHLVRLNEDGSRDTSFGTGGATDGPASGGTMRAMISDTTGAFIVAGSAPAGANAVDTATMLRFDAKGEVDAIFGAVLTTGKDPAKDRAVWNDVVLSPDGNFLVLSGTAENADGTIDALLARYYRTGKIDETFGDPSTHVVRFRAPTSMVDTGFNTAVARSDQQIVAAGWFVPDEVSGKAKSYLYRFDATGKSSAGFPIADDQQQPTSPKIGFRRALRTGSGDDAVVLGETLENGITSVLAYQLTANAGAPLPGKTFTASNEDHVVGLVATPDAHFLALGSANSGENLQPILIRFGSDGFDRGWGGSPAPASLFVLHPMTMPGGIAIAGNRVVVAGSLTGQAVIQRIWL